MYLALAPIKKHWNLSAFCTSCTGATHPYCTVQVLVQVVQDDVRRAPGPGGFRFQGVHGFLTYSCPTGELENPIPDKEHLLEFIKCRRNYNAAVVASELHENGKSHYHVAVNFKPKLSTRDVTFFDYMGVHPNIVSPDNWIATLKYVTKDDNWIEDNMDVKTLIKPKVAAPKVNKFAAVYAEALELAEQGDIDKAKQIIRSNDPVAWCKSNGSIEAALYGAYKEGLAKRDTIRIIETNWKEEYLNIDINAKFENESWIRTHILVGPSGIGKTELAKYLLKKAGCKKIAVVRSVEQLRGQVDMLDGFVFDELNCNAPDVTGGRWTREAQISLLDRNEMSSLPCRYSNPILRPSLIRIITTNELTRAIMATDEAIARRLHVHFLGDKLYNENLE